MVRRVPSAPADVYDIDPGGVPFPAFCERSAGNGEGWTLLAKIDGAAPGWAYDALRWTDTSTFGGVPSLGAADAKYPSYMSIPFTELFLRFQSAGGTREIVVPIGATSMRALMLAPTRSTTIGRELSHHLSSCTSAVRMSGVCAGMNQAYAATFVYVGDAVTMTVNTGVECNYRGTRSGV